MFKRWFLQDQVGDGDGSAGAAGDAGTKPGAASAAAAGDKPAAGVAWPEDWRKGIAGDDEKALKQLSRYQSPSDIWNKARALEQKISSGELRSTLPKDATPDQVTQWRTENGIPAKPEEYDITDLKIPEEDKAVSSSYLAHMHSVNAPPALAKAGLEWYYKEVERVNEELATRDKEIATTTEEALRAEWGQEYKTNMNMVTGLLQSAPESVRDEFKHGRLANGQPIMANKEVLMWLNGMSREINPLTTVMPNAGANIAGAIDDEIASIEKLMKDDRKAYNADEKKQGRLRDLYEARDKAKGK